MYNKKWFINSGDSVFMKILKVNNEIMNSITYILYTEGLDYCYLIDCGYGSQLLHTLESIGKRVEAVFLTHAHYDHIYGLNSLKQKFPRVKVYTNSDGREALFDPKINFSKYHPEIEPFVYQYKEGVETWNDGDLIHLFEEDYMKVLFTPGHDVSCVSYVIGNNIFTGDSYIPGLKTISTFPRSDKELALKSTSLLKNMEKQGYNVLCGHHSYKRLTRTKL